MYKCTLKRSVQIKINGTQIEDQNHQVLVNVIKARWSGNEDLVKKILSNEKDIREKKKAAKKLLEYSYTNNTVGQYTPSPQVKRVGRPRKKTISESSCLNPSGGSETPELSYQVRRNLPIIPACSSMNKVPMAHSIQQLLMDRSVPNADTKPILTPSTSLTHKYTYKTVHHSVKDSSSRQTYADQYNRQYRKLLENGNAQYNSSSGSLLLQKNSGYDYSNLTNPQHSLQGIQPSWKDTSGQTYSDSINRQMIRKSRENGNNQYNNLGGSTFSQHNNGFEFSNFSNPNHSLPMDEVDAAINEYIPDIAGLLASNGSNRVVPSGPSTSPMPIFLRQDLWPTYQDGNANTTHQQQTQYHDNLHWNPQQLTSYLPNPSGYSEEVIISETQNSDTLSATENQEIVPVQASYAGTSGYSENDNQTYWQKSGLNSTLSSNNSVNTVTLSQPLNNNETASFEKTYWQKSGMNSTLCSNSVNTSLTQPLSNNDTTSFEKTDMALINDWILENINDGNEEVLFNVSQTTTYNAFTIKKKSYQYHL